MSDRNSNRHYKNHPSRIPLVPHPNRVRIETIQGVFQPPLLIINTQQFHVEEPSNWPDAPPITTGRETLPVY